MRCTLSGSLAFHAPTFFSQEIQLSHRFFPNRICWQEKNIYAKRKKICFNAWIIIILFIAIVILSRILSLLSWEKEYSFCVFGKNWNYKMTLIYFEYSKSREICKTGSSGMNERHNFQYRICWDSENYWKATRDNVDMKLHYICLIEQVNNASNLVIRSFSTFPQLSNNFRYSN